MNVGILTFYFADNYGAVLQCLALQEKCRELGCNVEIIDYKPFQMITRKSRVKSLLMKTKQQKLFQAFREEHFKMSKRSSEFDTVIVGSDQVWNPQIIGYDDYWIKPKLKYKRICSYAASLGKSDFTGKDRDFFLSHKDDLNKYAVLAVRESSAKNALHNIGIESKIVCDPTLLFYDKPTIYEELAGQSRLAKEKSLPKDYILVYSLEHSDAIDKIAEKLKAETEFQVVAMHPMNGHSQKCYSFVDDTDPRDFLYLIKNCTAMVTNSFHGLAFSYIFRKKVYCVNHSQLATRQTELIERSGFDTEKNEGAIFINADQSTEQFALYLRESAEVLEKMIKS